jgi:2-polyprenyl-6-hydroxyphenyl methylase/3-demethylubiquinone-9 3-methyltransferase
LFYERFAEQFDSRMNRYEVNKRVVLVFDDFLRDESLRDKTFLDAGCGTGLFSAVAAQRGAHVTSLDVGERLLSEVASKCDSHRVVGDVAHLPFADASFDVVLSTEVVEHLPHPEQGVRELCRVVKPGGLLILTTPNRIWRPTVRLATRLRLRPYEGFENWVSWPSLRRWVEESRLTIDEHLGFNAFPWIFSATHPVLDRLDALGRGPWRRCMINMALIARRWTADATPAER